MADAIPLSEPELAAADRRLVVECLDSGWVSSVGPFVERFEHAFAQRVGAAHAVACASGTAAIHLALDALGLERGDVVLCSDATFIASANPARHLGAELRFVDSEARTWNLDPERLREALADCAAEGRRVAAVIAVHILGSALDLGPIVDVCADYGVPLIEDAAEGLGGRYHAQHSHPAVRGREAGSVARVGCFSFNGNKIITTSGGGMLVTRHGDWAAQARFLATQARDPAPHYEHSTYGYNYRLSNICAAIGLGQMEVLDVRVARRREIFARYGAGLAGPGIAFMPEPRGLRSTRWLTAMTVDPALTGVTREDIRLMLLDERIEARPLWKPMHLQPLYAGAPYHGAGVDERLFANGLCLPSGSDMTDDQQDEVIGRVSALLDAPRQ